MRRRRAGVRCSVRLRESLYSAGMRRVAVDELEPGVVLARAVYSERGELLLNADIVLTERYIDLLRERGFSTVFVADRDTSDLGIEDIISERVRVTVTAKLCRLY